MIVKCSSWRYCPYGTVSMMRPALEILQAATGGDSILGAKVVGPSVGELLKSMESVSRLPVPYISDRRDLHVNGFFQGSLP